MYNDQQASMVLADNSIAFRFPWYKHSIKWNPNSVSRFHFSFIFFTDVLFSEISDHYYCKASTKASKGYFFYSLDNLTGKLESSIWRKMSKQIVYFWGNSDDSFHLKTVWTSKRLQDFLYLSCSVSFKIPFVYC